MKPLEKMTTKKTDDNKTLRPMTHPWKSKPAVSRTAGESRSVERTYGGRMTDPRF